MTEKERKTFLHVLERKLNNFRKRAPLYCQCVVLFDEDLVCITIPNLLDKTIRVPVDFSHDVSDCVKYIHDMMAQYFPVIECNGIEFRLDKVDFKSNTFVLKNEQMGPDWSAFYKMKRPVSLLLKDLQSQTLTPKEKESIFRSNIKEVLSEEDYRCTQL